MNNMEKEILPVPSTATFVLREHSPTDVARKMIQHGRQEEPFYIFNMDEVDHRVQHFRDMMPRVKIFYAIKSNDTSMMIKTAAALGLGFDCASPGEIYKMIKLNVPPVSIIYAIPAKTPDQMIYARKSGVKHTTFDTYFELKKLSKYWPDARLLLRIRVKGRSMYDLGEKFGCDYETEAIPLLEEAASLGLKVVGVAFHVGNVCLSNESYAVGIKHARALFDHEARAGRKMSILDIGGGFSGDRTDAIDEAATSINSAIDELFPDPDVQIIAEPGRYICESAFTLYCSIMNVKRVIKDEEDVNVLYLNDGLYGTLRFSEKWHTLSKFEVGRKSANNAKKNTLLWGPSGDSNDQVMKTFKVYLPSCSARDWLVFENHGAYTIVFSSLFSSIPIPLIRSVVSLELWERVRDHEVFTSMKYLIDPEVSNPLPLALPPLPARKELYEHANSTTLKV